MFNYIVGLWLPAILLKNVKGDLSGGWWCQAIINVIDADGSIL